MLGSADLSQLWGSFRLRRSEEGACVLQSATKGHLADLAVRSVAAHFALVVWQHLGHCGTYRRANPLRKEGVKKEATQSRLPSSGRFRSLFAQVAAACLLQEGFSLRVEPGALRSLYAVQL